MEPNTILLYIILASSLVAVAGGFLSTFIRTEVYGWCLAGFGGTISAAIAARLLGLI
jgi:hypothetical protein